MHVSWGKKTSRKRAKTRRCLQLLTEMSEGRDRLNGRVRFLANARTESRTPTFAGGLDTSSCSSDSSTPSCFFARPYETGTTPRVS